MKNLVISASAVSLLFLCGFVSKQAVHQSTNQQIRNNLLRLDMALQSCLDRTAESDPSSLQSLRAVQLREKVFFALTEVNSRTSTLDQQQLRETVSEAIEGRGLGSVCQLEIRNALKESRI